MSLRVFVLLLAALAAGTPALASGILIHGVVSDVTGAALPSAHVVVRDVATGREQIADTAADGAFGVDVAGPGTYLVVVRRAGFAEVARTVVVDGAAPRVHLPIVLEVGAFTAEVSVTAARSEREIRRIPLRIDTTPGEAVAHARSTGDALAGAANITPVGDGPFLTRPRLRGLDSTRLLVLVDGERLNTARQATERTGAEVGLVPVDTIESLEVVNGAGTLLYGSDALAGTINIITNRASFSPARRLLYDADGYFSSNEGGARGAATIGATGPRYALMLQAGAEQFGDYRAGAFDTEDTAPLFANGTLTRADTIDDAFGFAFDAFPDPFNEPFVRSVREIPNSSARADFVTASARAGFGAAQTLGVRYLRRHAKDIGFPDFAQPFFFNATSLPYSRLDRISVSYEIPAVTSWLANLSATAYYQKTSRLLRTTLPVQFPAPTPVRFFPISVMRLDIVSNTEQNVETPGVDLRAVFVPSPSHLVTTGVSVYEDRSRDDRTTSTTTSMIGQVALGARGPEALVFPSPIALGAPAVARPVRVPDARLRDIGVFAQDEWRIGTRVSVMGGVRADFYRVTSDATEGYSVDPLVAGAVPAIDPATLPDAGGAVIARSALTGDVGVVVNAGGAVTPFARIGRSYRHANLEELLFAGPATIGTLAPNITLEPEIGTNLDAGATFRAGRVSGGVFAFTNRYRNFIAQDLVVATTPAGPLAQATNYAGVRISGLEMSLDVPFVFRHGVLTLSGSGALTRGTIVSGTDPLTGASLADTPADNITPGKVVAAARFTDPGGRWWMEYGVRAQSDVDRVAVTLLESPFLIAQDLLALDGFTVHRAGAGVRLTRGRHRVRLTAAVENAGDAFYREQFQFAPARGRTVTIGLSVGAF
jgi:hemoglobin/transferrin/lactoferrin receptor protein